MIAHVRWCEDFLVVREPHVETALTVRPLRGGDPLARWTAFRRVSGRTPQVLRRIAVLPFSKRTPRADEAGEIINTGEFEVIRVGATPKVAQVARVPQMPPAQARAFQRSISDDERTMVMPQKPKSNPPGFIASPTPSTSLAPSLKTSAPREAKMDRPRPPMSMANDEHTIVRPQDMSKNAFAAGRPSPVAAPTPRACRAQGCHRRDAGRERSGQREGERPRLRRPHRCPRHRHHDAHARPRRSPHRFVGRRADGDGRLRRPRLGGRRARVIPTR